MALARYRFYQPLLDSADGEFRLTLREAFERGDADRAGLGQRLADGADVVGREARLVMMARHQSPQPVADHQGANQRGADAHVLQVFLVNGGHAAQAAQGHVQVAAVERRQPWLQGHWRVVDIDEQADAVSLIQPAGDLRNVRCGVPIAEESLQVRAASFGKDLAVSFLVEAINHHAVIAGEILEYRGGFVAERAQRRRRGDAVKGTVERQRDIRGAACRFELEDEAAVGRAMNGAVEFALRGSQAAAHGHRLRVQRFAKTRKEFRQQAVVQRGKRKTDDRVDFQEFFRIGACLNDDEVRFLHGKQDPMRLNRPREMDLLTLAICKRRLSEGGRCKGNQSLPP